MGQKGSTHRFSHHQYLYLQYGTRAPHGKPETLWKGLILDFWEMLAGAAIPHSLLPLGPVLNGKAKKRR